MKTHHIISVRDDNGTRLGASVQAHTPEAAARQAAASLALRPGDQVTVRWDVHLDPKVGWTQADGRRVTIASDWVSAAPAALKARRPSAAQAPGKAKRRATPKAAPATEVHAKP